MKFNPFFGIKNLAELVQKKYNQDLLDIRNWWDDHNSGARMWDNVNTVNLTATNFTSPNGTVNTGTTPLLAFYAATGNAVSGMNANASAGSNKITNLANGTASTDAAAFGQIYYGFQASVQSTSSVADSTNSTSFVNTSLSASITPTSASHRIKITVCGTAIADVSSDSIMLTIARGSTNLGGSNGISAFGNFQFTGGPNVPAGMSIIDSPATTSSVTYHLQFASAVGHSVEWNGSSTRTTFMILEEIV